MWLFSIYFGQVNAFHFTSFTLSHTCFCCEPSLVFAIKLNPDLLVISMQLPYFQTFILQPASVVTIVVCLFIIENHVATLPCRHLVIWGQYVVKCDDIWPCLSVYHSCYFVVNSMCHLSIIVPKKCQSDPWSFWMCFCSLFALDALVGPLLKYAFFKNSKPIQRVETRLITGSRFYGTYFDFWGWFDIYHAYRTRLLGILLWINIP